MRRLLLLVLLVAPVAFGNSCSTTFPTTQNPISSQGTCSWISGAATGIDWGDVSVVGGTPGQAHGTVISGAPPYNDSTAVVTGSWGTSQYASAIVAINGTDASSQQEVELRTHTTITAHSITGYEFDLSVKSGSLYVVIVRWNGALNSFTYCANGGTCNGVLGTISVAVPNNTVIEASSSAAGVHTLYVNGIPEFTTTDTTYTGGSPGIGFWQVGGTTANLTNFGLKSFSASDTTYPAASNSQSSVNAVINGPTHTAVNGDTILIPCNSSTVTWTSQIAVTKSITISGMGATPNTLSSQFGAGTNCITVSVNNNTNSLFSLAPTYASGQVLTLQNLNFDPIGASTAVVRPIDIQGTCTAVGCPQVRVDNITFGKTVQWTGANSPLGQSGAMVRWNNSVGVLDHNTMPSGDNAELVVNQMQAYLGVGDFGDNSVSQPLTLGTGNSQYMENNLFFSQTWAINDCEAPGPMGCRFVARYNHLTQSTGGSFGIVENHGSETGGRYRGGVQMEVYDNQLTCLSACTSVIGGLRSGTAIEFANAAILTPGQGANNWLGISYYRRSFAATPWNAAGGNGPWDQNDGVQYDTGTTTSGTSGSSVTVSGKTWTTNQWAVQGNAYSFHDITGAWYSEIQANTATTLTLLGPVSEQPWSAVSGDSYEILRAPFGIDQPGHVGGTVLSGTSGPSGGPTPTGYPSQTISPIYQAADTFSGGANVNAPTSSNSLDVISLRDYFDQASAVQTTSSSPFSCNGSTGGVGWGTLARRPTTCTSGCSANNPGCGYFATDQGAQGTLYAWESGAWVTYYVPYVYPNPLVSGIPAITPVATPTFSPVAGTYPPPQNIAISTSTGGATICFTTDGTTPTGNGAGTCTHGTTYSTTVPISVNTFFQAIGSESGFTDSSVGSASYTIRPSAPNPSIFAKAIAR